MGAKDQAKDVETGEGYRDWDEDEAEGHGLEGVRRRSRGRTGVRGKMWWFSTGSRGIK